MGLEFGKALPLPCAANCPFGRKCAVKISEEDSCAEAIYGAIKREVSKYHSELTEDGEKLGFTTVDPDTWGYIFNGELVIWPRR